MYTKYCTLCRSKTLEKNYLVPKDESRRELWSRSTGVELTSTSTICSKHFKDSDFSESGIKRRRLMPTALPQKPAAGPDVKQEFTEHISSACGDNVSDFSSQTEQEVIDGGLALENLRLQIKVADLNRENAKLLAQLGKMQTLNDSLNIIFTKSQVRKLQNGGKRVEWNREDISNAICLHAAGPRAYRHLISKGFPLPSLATLHRWLQSVDIQPGILDFVISLMENAVEMDDKDKICILHFDKMKVTSAQKVQDYVQVAMAQGLRKFWSHPIYFDFDKPMTVSTLNMLIKKLYMVGYHVVGVINDMGPGNRKLWADLRVSPETSWFEHPADSAKRVYVFADVPHLVNLIRNQFLDSGLVVNGKVLTQQSVRQAMIHASSTDLSLEWKVTDDHLKVCSAGRQRDTLASTLFSKATASVIRRCYSLGLHVDNATEMADFFQLVNDWFAIFDVQLPASDKIPTKQPFGNNLEAQRQILGQMSQVMSQVVVPNGQNRLPFQKGILISNSSLDDLFKYLADRYNFKYIITGLVSLDQLNNFFGAMRAADGQHDHPSPLEFKLRLRKYLLDINIGSNDHPCFNTTNINV